MVTGLIKQIGLPLHGRSILLITRMITNRIGRHKVLLPIHHNFNKIFLIYKALFKIKTQEIPRFLLAVRKKAI